MRVFIAIALLAATVSASAETWTSVGKSEHGEMLIDASTIRAQGKWIKAWTRFNHTKEQPFRGKGDVRISV